jgi:F-type H+-transporting ATPase subunit delta
MARKAYARRYAQAVFEIALEKNELERWQTDLQKITGAIADGAFLAALESPKIKLEDKAALLKALPGGISPLTVNLVSMLITRGGVAMIAKIAGEYQLMLADYHGILKAEVVTAVPIDDKDKEKLAERLSALVDKRVVLQQEVDPEILGGIIARVGGKLLDGSTRSKLAALKRELVGGAGTR